LEEAMGRSVIPALIALLALSACSKPTTGAGPAAPSGSAVAAAAPAGAACDRKLVTAADAARILGEPVASEKTLQGDPQSCVFETATFASMTIALRPGLGRVTVDAWASGKMPVPATQVAGVGERAAWQPTLKEINAEKNDLLCDIGVVGAGPRAGATPEALGALCNRIFAAG
jgi:hypothetical protein